MRAPITMADLPGLHAEAAGEVEPRVLSVLRSGRWVGGPVVAEAEALCARWFGREAGVGVASGTDALTLALAAVGVAPGDEVIVPAVTFFATAGAVCQLGAVPVIVDVREDGTLDPEAARRAAGRRTRAVVPVHLFGNRAADPRIDVVVVDDAAQAAGAEPGPSIGALTALSVYPTKTWAAAGDGGFVVGDAEGVARVRALGHHGAVGPHVHDVVADRVGRNSRLDAVQAAVLLGHAPYVAGRVAGRRRNAARYDAGLPASVRPLPRDAASPVHVYAVRVADRDAVRAALAEVGIEAQIYYPRPLHAQPALAGRAVAHPTPVADALCAEVLALPVHAGLADADVDRVLDALHRIRG